MSDPTIPGESDASILATGTRTDPSQVVGHVVLDCVDRTDPETSDTTVTVDHTVEIR